MAVLSDDEIRSRMTAGGLVIDGDLSRATQCSYSFVAGAAFQPGSVASAVAFPGANGDAEVLVKPGEMIWIRTFESVALPDDLVAFWWQTNALSRKGLMLVNMSMVEPGYQGDLACLFVNFGKDTVVIDAGTVIAKMIFVNLTGTVAAPLRLTPNRADYDRVLRQLAVDQPSSFMGVGDLRTNLDKARESALAEIVSATATAKADAAKAMGEAKDDAVKSFRSDIPRTIIGSSFWAASAIALLTVVGVVSEQIKGHFVPDVQGIARSEAESMLRDHVTITATPGSADTMILTRKIDDLTRKVEDLEKHR